MISFFLKEIAQEIGRSTVSKTAFLAVEESMPYLEKKVEAHAKKAAAKAAARKKNK